MADQKVVGVREALKALGDVEPALRRQAQAEMRKAAQPLAAAVSSALPGGPPLSGMTRGRLAYGPNARKVSAKTGGRARGKDSWPLVSVRTVDAAAQLFDMAGRGSSGKTPRGVALIGALTSRYGGASRAVWPAAERAMPQVQAAVLQAVKDASARVQVRLDVRPPGA